MIGLFLRREKQHMPFMGRRMHDVRKIRKITQKQLATTLRIKQRRISEYENGKVDPGAAILSEIAIALNCSADYFLGLKDTVEIDGLRSLEREYITRVRATANPDRALIQAINSLIDNLPSE